MDPVAQAFSDALREIEEEEHRKLVEMYKKQIYAKRRAWFKWWPWKIYIIRRDSMWPDVH